MEGKVVHVPVETLREFMYQVFLKCGVPEEDAKICADVLITSDIRGIPSHGINRLKMYYDRIKQGILSPITRFEIVRETQTTAVVDGHHGMGHVIGYRSMKLAIEKAREYGMGAVAARNSSHFGIAGYYALMAAEEGMIGMAFTNARPSVAPTFSVEPMFGTNPIAFACPTDEEFPFCFDAATSITQRGKIEVLARLGKPTPAGWVISCTGELATDTEAILKGIPAGEYALLPLGGAGEEMGGHKGYGLAVMVEILCAALQSGAFLKDLSGFDEEGNLRPHQLGHFFLAIDIGRFVPLEEFRRTAGEILRRLRAAELAPGAERIYTAGEKAHLAAKRAHERGIPINEDLQRDIKFLQEELGLSHFDFPF
ncbi:MAG: Ldh family oxidoreductase [Caldiserica bacterium]|nr:Ldh family oxidoreductase [Caldisericota bacterium]